MLSGNFLGLQQYPALHLLLQPIPCAWQGSKFFIVSDTANLTHKKGARVDEKPPPPPDSTPF